MGGGSEGKEVCGLALETGGGSGVANIGGGNECRPSDTGGGVGRGTDVAVAGDNCDDVLLLQRKQSVIHMFLTKSGTGNYRRQLIWVLTLSTLELLNTQVD